MARDTYEQTLALRALMLVAREHIGSDFEKDDTLTNEIDKGHRRHDDQTVFHVVCEGKCEISAEITVHDKANDAYRISVLILTYRRLNQATYHLPNALFYATLT